MDISTKNTIDITSAPEVAVQVKQRQTAAQVVEELKVAAAESRKVFSEVADNRKDESTKPVVKKNDADEIAELQKSESQIDKLFSSYTNRKMQFSVDAETGKTVIRLFDRESGELIRQIPQQEFLDMVSALNKIAQSVIKDLPKYI